MELISGQPVYITCGLRIEPAKFVRHICGRCLVTMGTGGITVNRNRVFASEDEARKSLPADCMKRIREDAMPHEPAYAPHDYDPNARKRTQHNAGAQYWQSVPVYEPGDGWARR